MIELNTKTKTISATISENVIEAIDQIVSVYKHEGFKVSRSQLIQSALKKYINNIEQIKEKKGA